MVRAVVADLSHYTWDKMKKVDFEKAKAAGVVGILYKASKGASYRDPTSSKRRWVVMGSLPFWHRSERSIAG